jgi:DNA-binding transcriptional ArsR family regulator
MLKSLRLSSSPADPRSGRKNLLTPEEAERIARHFSALASATRVQILHVIIHLGTPCVSDIMAAVEMKAQAVSNQLRKLTEMGILRASRRGNHVHYRLEHPAVKALLRYGLELSGRMEKGRIGT